MVGPGGLMPRLFDPVATDFSYKRLRGPNEELRHDPLVNLNPSSAERRKSATSSPAPAHTCIMCSRTFSTSEEVQRHLLAEHIAAAATAAGTTNNEATNVEQPSIGSAAVMAVGDDEKKEDVETAGSDRDSSRQAGTFRYNCVLFGFFCRNASDY